MLGTLLERDQTVWHDHAVTLVHAYYCTRSNATSFSPYYLMFGRKLKLLIDHHFGTCSADLGSNNSTKFMEKLQKRLKWAYKLAQETTDIEQQRH